jgi:rare lipoprotein A
MNAKRCHARKALFCGIALFVAACGPRPLRSRTGSLVQRGRASWYGERHHGRRTASGERFDMHDYTAAHRRFPFGTRLRVTNLRNGRQVVVRVNDRGPFGGGRIIDVSYAAAKSLGMVSAGSARVLVEVVSFP